MENLHASIDEWKARKQQERENVILAQKQALDTVMESTHNLCEYLVGRGRLGSHISSGNAALILQKNEKARAVKNYKQWQEYGRSICKGEAGISILVRKDKYFIVDKVFDISQTYGNRPCPAPFIENDPEQLKRAIQSLEQLCPVNLEYRSDGPQLPVYDPESKTIACREDITPQELFQYLPEAVLMANTESYSPGISESLLLKVYGAAISIELCGHFGISLPENVEERLEGFENYTADSTPRAMLEEIREISRTMGDYIEKNLSIERKAPTIVKEEVR